MRAVVLTKSPMYKNGKQGLCVTAYDLNGNQFIRMVDGRDNTPVSYGFASGFNTMDLIEFDVSGRFPQAPQMENVGVYYRSIKNLGHYEPGIKDIYQRHNSNNEDGSYMDVSAFRLDSVDEYQHSVEIIKVSSFAIVQDKWGRWKARFEYNGMKHWGYSVTDPNYDPRKNSTMNNKIGNAYIVVSIPNTPYINKKEENIGYFKFIAAIYPDTD